MNKEKLDKIKNAMKQVETIVEKIQTLLNFKTNFDNKDRTLCFSGFGLNSYSMNALEREVFPGVYENLVEVIDREICLLTQELAAIRLIEDETLINFEKNLEPNWESLWEFTLCMKWESIPKIDQERCKNFLRRITNETRSISYFWNMYLPFNTPFESLTKDDQVTVKQLVKRWLPTLEEEI